MVQQAYDCSLVNDSVLIKRITGSQSLEISFRRTVRVPDNNEVCALPPDLGRFPLYKVKDYAATLTSNMIEKGGLFLPMHSGSTVFGADGG